jgi:Tfp pilus assembly protein PilN
LKPIHLNLARRPYRDYKPLYAVVVAMALLIAFLMLNNVDTYLRYVHETKNTRGRIDEIAAETAKERERAAVAQRRIAALDLKLLDSQSRFVNTQLAQRAFSWSELLDRLEDVLPNDVKLTSITPSFLPSGRVALTMQFTAKGSNGMIRTLERLLADPNFHNPFPGSEQTMPDGFQFNVTTDYQPSVARVAQ